MEIIICDDSEADRSALYHYIDRFFKERSCPAEITVYENGESLGKHFVEGNVQIAFLDIYMPGISGVDLAKKMRETDSNLVIIFTTSSVDHGIDGFAVSASGYLVKPVEYHHVEKVLLKCVKLFAESMRFIEVLSNRLTVKVLLKDILFVEVYTNACLLHTRTGDVKTYCTLDEIERKLGEPNFLRCHRTHIVNMNYIADMSENNFLLKNGVEVLIRKADKLKIKQTYSDYMFSLARQAEL
ncbi:MAG: response regulator transcription factor [Paenibacillaceae bacterium]|nr:response regulator transcription factor [Paenibacillaceae bacterium]